jgi:hypothetical protein
MWELELIHGQVWPNFCSQKWWCPWGSKGWQSHTSGSCSTQELSFYGTDPSNDWCVPYLEPRKNEDGLPVIAETRWMKWLTVVNGQWP